MKLTIAAIGRAGRGPERDLYEHYAGRIRWPLTLKELEEKKKLPPAQLVPREGELLLAAVPGWAILVLALLYSAGAHGIMTLNDFKAIGGDIQCGVRSLPVQLGVTRAAWVSSGVMLAPSSISASTIHCCPSPST